MESEVREAQTTPGEQIHRLSRAEVTKAIFVAAYGREPTANEVKRLSIYIAEDHHLSTGSPWQLSLSLTDPVPEKKT